MAGTEKTTSDRLLNFHFAVGTKQLRGMETAAGEALESKKKEFHQQNKSFLLG